MSMSAFRKRDRKLLEKYNSNDLNSNESQQLGPQQSSSGSTKISQWLKKSYCGMIGSSNSSFRIDKRAFDSQVSDKISAPVRHNTEVITKLTGCISTLQNVAKLVTHQHQLRIV